MKKQAGIVFTAIALVTCLSAVRRADAQVVNQLLKQIGAQHKAMRSLRMNVTHEIYDSVLRESEKREGRAIYLPQKNLKAVLRVDWKKPEETYALVNKKYAIYRPRLKQAYVGSFDEVLEDYSLPTEPLAFLKMSKAELRASYLFRYLGREKLSTGRAVWHLELTPKTAQKYKKVDLWIDGSGLVRQVKILENNNDTNSVLLSRPERNVKGLKGSDFQIDLPPDTKVIKY
jgi:outer membrane lipoprotein-sorting protein